MQYSVPQFVDVEDKIIGPLTLKQFLMLLGGGLVIFMYWSIFDVGVLFFLLALPTAFLFVGLAFGKFNGRPLMVNMVEMAKYFFTPKYRLFHRAGAGAGPMFMKRAPEAKPSRSLGEGGEEKSSRLKRLAYLLDQKGAEEERLIHSGKMPQTWLNQV